MVIWTTIQEAMRAQISASRCLAFVAAMQAILALGIGVRGDPVGYGLAVLLLISVGGELVIARRLRGNLRILEEDMALIDLDPELEEHDE